MLLFQIIIEEDECVAHDVICFQKIYAATVSVIHILLLRVGSARREKIRRRFIAVTRDDKNILWRKTLAATSGKNIILANFGRRQQNTCSDFGNRSKGKPCYMSAEHAPDDSYFRSIDDRLLLQKINRADNVVRKIGKFRRSLLAFAESANIVSKNIIAVALKSRNRNGKIPTIGIVLMNKNKSRGLCNRHTRRPKRSAQHIPVRCWK